MAYGDRLSRFIYYRVPVWGQNLACSVYGYRHKKLWGGHHFRDTLAALRANQWKSQDELFAQQRARLEKLTQHAYEFVPFYRNQWKSLGITPNDLQTIEDLRNLPLLDKETLRQNPDAFVSSAFDRRSLIESHTSGTTGKQLTLWVSREAYQREYAFRWLHYSWCGVQLDARRAYLSGHPVVAPDSGSPPFSRKNVFERSLIFSSQHLSESNIPSYLRDLKAFQPEFLEGYPSSLFLLASYMNSHKVDAIRSLRGVYAISETLFDFQRAAIEAAFRCKVFNWYGNTERAGNITECVSGNLHVQLEHSVIEINDSSGASAEDGCEGEVVATALGNFAFPLIRYRTGDLAASSRGKCSCGRNSPLVSHLTGRIEQYVISPDGRLFGRLDHIFKDAKNVREAQVEQSTRDQLILRISPRREFNEVDREALLRAARERVGSSFRVKIEFVEQIPRGANGKFKFVLNRVVDATALRESFASFGNHSTDLVDMMGSR